VILTTADDLILPREAAQIIGKTERWVHRLADQGKLPIAKEEAYGKGRKRRWFRRADVEAYANGGTL
jgi:Helix-turn-helix domain